MVCCCFSCSHPQFFGALQIVAPLEDTCIEIYSVNGDSYVQEHGVYLETTYDTYTYTSNVSTVVTLAHCNNNVNENHIVSLTIAKTKLTSAN